MKIEAEALVNMADDTGFSDDFLVSVYLSEVRALVFELRYALSKAESAALAAAEREAGEDADGNLLTSAEDYATIRGHEYVHVASCPCPQMTERWAHLRQIERSDD